jgi:predicted DNA-binding transcriptional regulator AlpA
MRSDKEVANIEGQAETEDRVIWRRELQAAACVTSETIRRWMRDGKLPSPDVNLSHRTKGWRVSTLLAAGINLLN